MNPRKMAWIAIFGLVTTGMLFPLGCAKPVGNQQTDNTQTSAAPPTPPQASDQAYQGSTMCAVCHFDIFSEFVTSGHPFALSKVVGGQPQLDYNPAELGIPGWVNPVAQSASHANSLPYSLTWNDISFVVGGFNHSMNFLGPEGHLLITGNGSAGPGAPTMFTLPDPLSNQIGYTWENYDTSSPGHQTTFNCGNCHATGYTTTGNQNSMTGIQGAWALSGVQCEACHGPGGLHALSRNPADIVLDRTSALCSQCHAPGFMTPDMPTAEMLDSGMHAALECVSCHDPHLPATAIEGTACNDCHSTEVQGLAGGSHAGATCVGCHDPHVPAASSEDCKTCHQTEYTALQGTSHSPVTCGGCHDPHKAGTPAANCQTCHQTQVGEMQSTKHSAVSCGSCHNAHKPGVSPDTCKQCHSSEYNALAGQKHSGVTCMTCHDPHKPVTTTATCATCHSTQYTAVNSTAHSNISCSSCHQNGHTPAASNITTTCRACHSSQHGSSWTSNHSSVSCTYCHDQHVVSNKKYDCNHCHN